MNEQLAPHNFSGEPPNNMINSTLITMQIQALRESLRRLVEPGEESETQLSDNGLDNQQLNSTC